MAQLVTLVCTTNWNGKSQRLTYIVVAAARTVDPEMNINVGLKFWGREAGGCAPAPPILGGRPPAYLHGGRLTLPLPPRKQGCT